MTKIYVILNTKTNEVKEVTEKQIEDRCCGYNFYDDNDYRASYEATLENLESEEEKEDQRRVYKRIGRRCNLDFSNWNNF